ncbi:MAG TPA: hypothetical protein VJ867_13050 [Gemmatimonadaceae bacterium]|nr:hypothetical protein [Gemmatimonadaceae bacterium]
MKRLLLVVTAAAAAVLLVAPRAAAQNDPSGKWVLRASGGARRAVAASPRTTIIVVPRQPYYPRYPYGGYPQYTVGGSSYTVRDASRRQRYPMYPDAGPTYVAYPVAYTYIPAVLLSDGTVLANFGMGFEVVQRFCGSTYVSNSPLIVSPNGQPVMSGDLPPAPNQATQSAQNLPSNQRFPVRTGVSQTSCYLQAGDGGYLARY